ncbi:facilitated trehalose transporter Tret1 [Drosophila bipectinata]|uniref:facilitated trehalose transporter Tret1 n=1 Tax=Drosophila bipectinata TaxID=42026 RepID=UPI001C89D884|nr:facilitated trehalose transporter Tret1 [Drosophila bipectinata]
MGVVVQFVAGLIAALGAFCLGCVIGWSGPVELEVKAGKAYNFTPNTVEWGLTGSLMTLGGAFSCIPVGVLISKIGRKITMLGLVIPFMLGWACIIYPLHIAMLLIGRFVVGFCGGSFCVAAPVYNTEIAELRFRGIQGCFFQLMVVHGILYAFVAGAFCKVMLFNIACAVWPIIFFVLFFFMPESPVYLQQKGKSEQAEKSLKYLRGKDADVSGEMKEIAAESNKDKEPIGKAMCRKATKKGLFISIMLMLFQQMTGINAIMFYSTSIFEAAGSTLEPRFATIVIGVVQVFATVTAIFLIERVGRKILLLVSAFMMGLSTLTMCLYFGMLMDKKIGWLALVALCLFIIGFSLGFGPIPWAVNAELFAEDAKTLAGGIAGTCNWVFAFCVTLLFPILNEKLGACPCFGIFAGFAVAAIVFILFLVPETKGKTLNEIQAKLGGE